MIPKWKKEQKEKKFKKQKKSVLRFFGLFCFVLILASTFRFFSGFKNSKVFGLSRVNFLVNDWDKVGIISVIGNNKLIFLDLPGEKKINLTRGFGKYPISSIFTLGEIEKMGGELLKESIQEFFGISISGLLIFKDKFPKNRSELERILLEAGFGKVKTDFSKYDLFALWWRVKRVPEFESARINLNDLDCFEPDGEFSLKKIDLIVRKYFQDEKVVNEDLAVAVFNSTDFSGLGNQGERVLSNLGGRVVNVSNSETKEVSLIKSTKKIANSYTLKILQRIFGFMWKEAEVEAGRADIGIYLGKDYWKKLNEKW